MAVASKEAIMEIGFDMSEFQPVTTIYDKFAKHILEMNVSRDSYLVLASPRVEGDFNVFEYSTTHAATPLEINEEDIQKAMDEVRGLIEERDRYMEAINRAYGIPMEMLTPSAMCIAHRHPLTKREIAPILPEINRIPVEEDSVFAPREVEVEV